MTQWKIQEAQERAKHPLPNQEVAKLITELQNDIANLLALVDRLGAVNKEQKETIQRLQEGGK